MAVSCDITRTETAAGGHLAAITSDLTDGEVRIEQSRRLSRGVEPVLGRADMPAAKGSTRSR